MNHFGSKIVGQAYRERVGAYAVAFDEKGCVALVEAPAFRNGEPWLFLPGGGIEQSESHEECILRECLEETGCTVQVDEYIGEADEYLTSLKIKEYMHLTGHFYRVHWGEKVQKSIEEDHTLLWVPVEQCYKRMFCKYQIWAVKTAWEKEKEKKI